MSTVDSTIHLSKDSLDEMFKRSMCFAMEQNDAKVYEFPTLGLILVCLSIFATFYYLRNSLKAKKFKDEHKRNFRDVGKWVVILAVFFAGFYFLGLIHPTYKKGFLFSHGDILLLFASIIAIIGAFWAIYARIDAERAFTESQNAFKASTSALDASIQTRLSFGNSFSFPIIFEEDYNNKRLPHIISKVGENNFVVSLYIGFPCVGYFYRQKTALEKDRIDIDKIKKHFYELITKLDEILKDKSDKEYTLNLGIFNKEEIKKCFPELTGKEEPNIPHIADRNLLQDWDEIITKLIEKKKDVNWSEKKKINIIFIKREEERFRFAFVRQVNGHEQRALIWVVPDFYFTNTLEFESAGFQTSDLSIIAMLEKVFGMEKHSLKTVADVSPSESQ